MAISHSKKAQEKDQKAVPFFIAYELAEQQNLDSAEVAAIGTALYEMTSVQEPENSYWWSNGLAQAMRGR